MASTWDQQFAEAGRSLGLQPAKFAKQVGNIWQLVPLIAEGGHLVSSVHGCVNGTWEGRRASASVMLPIGGGPGPMGNAALAHWGHHRSENWSEGTVLVTSVGFIAGSVPFMMAAPAAPQRINERTTYETTNWILPATAEYFGQLPVPGDTDGAWVVRSPRVQKPSAVLAAIAPMLLSEAPYPWKIDGGKNGSHNIDLIRVDIAVEGTPPPTAELLRDRLNRLTQMASAIEQTLSQFPPGDYK